MTRMQRAALAVCFLGLLWVGPLPTGPARSAPALKDRKGLTKEARERLQKRVAALGEQLTGGFERVKIGKDSLADYLPALREWYETKIALADTREAERAVLENASRFLFVVEEQLAQLHQAGLQSYDSVLQAQAARAKVQSELEKRRGGR